MNIRINGKNEELPDAAVTLHDLVTGQGLAPERVVMEVNLKVIPREQWRDVFVRDHDQIEMVSFVGGG